jgi:hypothetical protein
VLITGASSVPDKSTWAFNRLGTSAATVENNVFLNLRTRTGAGSGDNYAANQPAFGTGTLIMDNNVYSGTGLGTGANFFDLSDGTSNYGIAASYAQWQAYVPSDTHSSAGNPGGNFTSAMFVDAANGDLHLVPGGNVLVNSHGTPIAGVIEDFDGDLRSATVPTIGADEFTQPNAFSTWAAANGVASNPNAAGANGMKNLLNFAFGISPTSGGGGGLQYAGTFAGNGSITATGLPVTMVESAGNGVDLRALFVRRKDFAAAGLTYTPQFSADLSTWQDSAAVPVVLADDSVNQIVSVPFPAFIAGKNTGFFCISVALAP